MQEKIIRIFTPLELALSLVALALSLVLPAVFHYFGLGRAFLPLYIPVILLAAGVRLSWPVLVTAAVTPLLSSIITGMPALPVAMVLAAELTLAAFLLGKLRERPVAAALLALPVILAGRALAFGGLSLWFAMQHHSQALKAAWAFVMSGWKGVVLLTVLAAGLAVFRAVRTNAAR